MVKEQLNCVPAGKQGTPHAAASCAVLASLRYGQRELHATRLQSAVADLTAGQGYLTSTLVMFQLPHDSSKRSSGTIATAITFNVNFAIHLTEFD